MNLQEVNREYGNDTPTPAELANIKVGSFVRLATIGGSRFWARVLTERRSNGTYTARSMDTLPSTMGAGALVVFEPQAHVFEVV